MTLSFTAVYAVLVFLASGLVGKNLWFEFACLAVSTYLMVEFNNVNALLRVYSRMISCAFLVLACAANYLCLAVGRLGASLFRGFLSHRVQCLPRTNGIGRNLLRLFVHWRGLNRVRSDSLLRAIAMDFARHQRVVHELAQLLGIRPGANRPLLVRWCLLGLHRSARSFRATLRRLGPLRPPIPVSRDRPQPHRHLPFRCACVADRHCALLAK